MSTRFALSFGSGNPQDYSGLTPTFILFRRNDGTDLSAPPIAEVGVSSGLYGFTYAPSATFTVYFIADGGASISDASTRYVKGSLDAVAKVDQEIGFAGDSYGTTALPSGLVAYAARLVQLIQSDSTFNKSTGVWDNYAQGTSTLLYRKTLTNSSSSTTKT